MEPLFAFPYGRALRRAERLALLHRRSHPQFVLTHGAFQLAPFTFATESTKLILSSRSCSPFGLSPDKDILHRSAQIYSVTVFYDPILMGKL